MTDQKITTTQDLLDQHYEEVEALHREIARLQEINAKLDSNCEAAIRKLQAAHRMLMRNGVPCKSSDYVEAIVEEETIEGLKTVIVNASGLTLSCTICSKPIYNGTFIGEGIITGLEEAVEHAATTRDDKKAELLAKVLCRLEGIEPVDSMDGSCNWWMFKGLADEVVKKLAGGKDA